ncbi:hypothetical protein KR50_24270 [Jeotgalibacillus campisalis]|uniref:Uncharacterized protein n=1 Tax=Jeotgalibacillus campisalis TaxID=220754 RepID=A0A0C2R9X4_9BACL|nr:hypothetical protein KR50_24270 [Jeotgalibacillus campisalis]
MRAGQQIKQHKKDESRAIKIAPDSSFTYTQLIHRRIMPNVWTKYFSQGALPFQKSSSIMLYKK